jgi:hypothetical protein
VREEIAIGRKGMKRTEASLHYRSVLGMKHLVCGGGLTLSEEGFWRLQISI